VGDGGEAVEVVGGVAGGVAVAVGDLGEGAVGLVVELGDSILGVGGLIGEVALVEDGGGGVQLGVLDGGAVVVSVKTAGRMLDYGNALLASSRTLRSEPASRWTAFSVNESDSSAY
jgi:hypothetical protein